MFAFFRKVFGKMIIRFVYNKLEDALKNQFCTKLLKLFTTGHTTLRVSQIHQLPYVAMVCGT